MNAKLRARLEIGGVLASALAFIVLNDVLVVNRFATISTVCVLWVSYIVLRLWTRGATFADWGVRLDNLAAAAGPCAIFVAVGAAGMFIFRLAAGPLPKEPSPIIVPHTEIALPAHAVGVIALYGMWGIVQQLLMHAFVTDNLRRLGLKTAILVPVVGLVFGLVHMPQLDVVLLTIPTGAVWTYFWVRRPNVIALGVSHAILGTLAYYWVFQRDPWLEVFR